jgi:hypothetical protein
MLAGIPAVGRHVDAAAEGERVVDHDDLLVVRCAGGMRAVELELDPLVRHPVQDDQRRRAAADLLQGAEIPAQDVDLQIGPVLHHPAQEAPQPVRHVGIAVGPVELDAGVEVPSDHEQAMGRLLGSRPHRGEILGGIDDHREAICAGDAPAGLARSEQPVVLGWRHRGSTAW